MPETKPNQRYLIFTLGQQQYSLDSTYLEEMLPLPEITPLPAAAPDILGILNLRGEMVPILDLNLSLGYEPLPYRTTDSVIVLKQEQLQVGLIVSQIGGLELYQTIDVDATDTRLKAQRNQATRKQMIEGKILSVENSIEADAGPCWIINPPDQWLRYIEIQQLVSIASILEENPAALPAELLSPQTAVFCPEATAEERAIFQQRATSLRQAIAAEPATDSSTLAIVSMGEDYVGVDLSIVKEFTDIQAVTPIPCCPPHIIGNMNLRGEILTLVDLSTRLQKPDSSTNDYKKADQKKATTLERGQLSGQLSNAKVMVVEIDQYIAGILVNNVLEAMFPLSTANETPSDMASNNMDSRYRQGTFAYRDSTVSILDLPKVLQEGNLIVDEIVR